MATTINIKLMDNALSQRIRSSPWIAKKEVWEQVENRPCPAKCQFSSFLVVLQSLPWVN